MTMLSRRLTMIAVALAATLCTTQARAAPLTGTYSSPLGELSVVEKNGSVIGKTTSASNPCAFPKGTTVLDGSRLDDSITGNLRGCKVGDGCAGPIDGAVMLLVAKNGALLSGAAHFDGKCKTPLQGDGIALKKAGGKKAPPALKTTPAVAGATGTNGGGGDKKLEGTPRARAEALTGQGKALMESGVDGSIEEAREKFREASAIDPEYAEAHIGIGATWYLRGRWKEALENYKKAIEVNPSYPDAYYNVACVYALQNDPAQAMRYLRISFLNGWAEMDAMLADADLKNLEGNAEFERMKKGQL